MAREDHGPLLSEEGIAAGMVGMNVRVDQDPNRRRAECAYGAQHLLSEFLVLRIDQQDAVGAEEHRDAATGRVRMRRVEFGRALQDVQVRCELGRHRNLDLVPLRKRAPRRLRRSSHGKKRDRGEAYP
jgi:hypothetical protein